jgi:hypothetical protein
MSSESNAVEAEAGPRADLTTLGDKLVGTWTISGEAAGETTYEWMAGGYFLIQRGHFKREGTDYEYLQIIGYTAPLGPSRRTPSPAGSTPRVGRVGVAGRGLQGDHDPHRVAARATLEEPPMAVVIAGMTVSVDGFAADARGDVGRLYPDLAALQGSDYMNAAIAETGAVLMGRRAFEMGDPDSYVGNYEFQVPIFVLTYHPPATPPKQDERLTFICDAGGARKRAPAARVLRSRACAAREDRRPRGWRADDPQVPRPRRRGLRQ